MEVAAKVLHHMKHNLLEMAETTTDGGDDIDAVDVEARARA